MTIVQIGVLATLAVLVGRLRKGRQLALLAVNATAIFWLEPAEPVEWLAYWLPIGTLALAGASWALTSAPERRGLSETWPAVAVLCAVAVLVVVAGRLGLGWQSGLGAPRHQLLLAIVTGAAAAAVVLSRWRSDHQHLALPFVVALLVVFLILKNPEIRIEVENLLGRLRPGNLGVAPDTSLAWLGYSYLAFRLLHTVRDRQSGRLPAVSLPEYVNYACFFPAFTAGPIDRLERFAPELRSPLALEGQDWLEASRRIVFGLFKKFVLSDLLAVVAISDGLVPHVKSAGWMWVFLYAYALRIYFDFSGYTDVAIGMGRLMGVRLPENFAAPYLKPNIALFWNSWHMTLTQWFRAYVFNPLTRSMRSAQRPLPAWFIILATQISTMVLIGLWHGITWGFAAWGLWHGLGLFVHNRWANAVGNRLPEWVQSGRGRAAARAVSVFGTFNFVAVGWLFFGLSTPALAWQALLKLVGAA